MSILAFNQCTLGPRWCPILRQHRCPTIPWLLWRQDRRCSILNWWYFAAVLHNIVRCPFHLFWASHHWRSGRCGPSATWQKLRSWSTTDSNTQVRYRCPRAFFDWTIQSFTYNQLRSSRIQDCVHLTLPEKGWSRFIGRAIQPSHLQFISPFEATWKIRCSPAHCPSKLKRPATNFPVGVSSLSLNWCAEGLDGHSSCNRRRIFICPCFAEPIGGLRYGRSWYYYASIGLFISDRGISTTMVSILPVKRATARASRIFLLITLFHGVWCTPWFRPWCHTSPSVLRRPAADHW